MDNFRKTSVIILFTAILFGFCISCFILPDIDISISERRTLAQIPSFSLDAVFSGRYMSDFDKYMTEQFPLRNTFRTANAIARIYVLRQSDNNGYVLYNETLFKNEGIVRTDQVLYAASRFNSIYEKYLDGMDVYYSIIPDKTCFLDKQQFPLSLNYENFVVLLNENVQNMQYIDIFNCLTIDDYYSTDTHWRQERIHAVAERLVQCMDAVEGFLPASEYSSHEFYPFYGVYYGQAALPVQPDTLFYLTSHLTDTAILTDTALNEVLPVYNKNKLYGSDSYEVFLSGAQAIITLECESVPKRELIIFRDSFAGSMAPLLLGAYSKITLIDLRYVSSELLPKYISFDKQDVLFLLSTGLLNSGMLLK